MNGLSASTIIVSIMAAAGIAPGSLATFAVQSTTPTMTAARAAILQGGTMVAPNGQTVVFSQA